MRKIVVTAGHSSTDPGAVGHGKTEADIVLEFRDLVADALRAAGIAFVKDGERDQNLPLPRAIALVTPGSVAVEFHCNAAAAPAVTGVETLSHEQNRALGLDLCAAVAEVLGIPNRGAKGEGAGQHSRLGFVRAGGLILELFFISNASDQARYQANKLVLAERVAGVLAAHALRA